MTVDKEWLGWLVNNLAERQEKAAARFHADAAALDKAKAEYNKSLCLYMGIGNEMGALLQLCAEEGIKWQG